MTRDTPEGLTDIKLGLGARSIVFVGLMGAGKTAIGRKVAGELSLSFVDSDHEIETASRMTIPELFERYGETEFRALEQRVITRVLEAGPLVLSTGAGAEMRAAMGLAVFSGMIGVTFFGIFMTPVFYVLLRRLAGNRPLVQHGKSTMEGESEAHAA